MSEKIKVLHIVEAFAGGMISVIQGIVNNTNKSFQHYILFNIRKESPKVPEDFFKKDVILIPARHLIREIDLSEDIKAISEVKRTFNNIQPDVVHLYSSKAGVIGRLALNGKKVAIFYSPQGYSFLMHDCSELKRKMYYIFEKICGYRTSMSVAACRGEYILAQRVSKKSTCINNGIDTKELDRFNLNVKSESKKIRVCTLGRIVSQKNPDMFNRIAQAFPDVEFVWIGGGELRERLTSENIEVTGWMTKEKALDKLLESSVFILTSYYEGFPLALIEAMYLKRCCIVSSISGNVDAIKDRKTGYICGTFEEYVDIISQLKENGIDNNMLEAAHDYVLNELNQTVMAEKYEKIYKEEIERLRKTVSQ
ncbi:glycosyltransferase [Zhenpiania hominis]|uniref:Glycosyltransferase n=1 Tax=Zhenpiania hominis TaxID=2763644 RepID=A0A923NKD7_9FIRM|nr:glycosyltransferase [Zhenpiania hominis]MBC6679566.1 glycosyltransferase [Zhenpiania hominis]